MSPRFRLLALFPLLLAVAACSSSKGQPDKPTSAGAEAPVEVGEPLYAGEFRPVKTPGAAVEPVQVPQAHVVILRKLDLPSRVDGAIAWVGVEITEDEAIKLKPQDVFRSKREKKFYRRLAPGDQIKRDQIVAIMDDDQAYIEYLGAQKKYQAASDEAAAYEKTVTKLAQIVLLTEEGARKGIVPQQEYLNSQATQIRYEADLTNRLGAKMIAFADLDKAKLMMDKHTLRSAIDGEIQQIVRHEGEGIKATEPILSVYSFDVLRIEGNLPKEYIGVVRPGDEVVIEGPRDIPAPVTFEQHTTNRPITAVAVGTRDGKPVVVSAADDGWVYAWGRDLGVVGSWKHATAVRAVAVTPPGVDPPLLLVGGENGRGTLYNLAAGDKAPLRELAELHDGGVTAAAFSADGKFCVTADERGLHMWETATGKRVYKFPAGEHHSPVTSLTFTRQGQVVSAGREPSVRVWQAGTKSARVLHRFDSRTGDVAMPGVTEDGSRLLLDADKTRLDVIHLQDGRKERPLIAAGEAARFQTFAAWSPEIDKKEDNRLIAAAGAAEGVVQLWRAPSATERGTEYARLICKNYAAASCAAFSPAAANGFVVVGTRKGEVNLWPLPADADLKTELKAKVSHVEQAIDSSGRTARVFVDFENPKKDGRYLMRPGSAVTLVIRPKN